MKMRKKKNKVITITIDISKLWFYSEHDEDCMFEWLGRIEGVGSVKGVLRTLLVEVDTSKVDSTQMTEFLSLFRRYRLDMDPLVDLIKPEFMEWLNRPKAYWYKNLFKRRRPNFDP